MCVNQQREEVVGVEGNWLPFIWYVNSLFYLFFSSFSLHSPHLLHRPLFYGCLPSFSTTPSRDDDPCINECNYIYAHLYMGSKQYVLSKDERDKKKSKRKAMTQWVQRKLDNREEEAGKKFIKITNGLLVSMKGHHFSVLTAFNTNFVSTSFFQGEESTQSK